MPKLSDLVADWAVEEGWPITVSASKQYPELYWVETKELIKLDVDAFAPAYIGTIHNDEAYFSPHSDIKENYFDAADPEFFSKLSYAIIKVFDHFSMLDKRTLPQGWQYFHDYTCGWQ